MPRPPGQCPGKHLARCRGGTSRTLCPAFHHGSRTLRPHLGTATPAGGQPVHAASGFLRGDRQRRRHALCGRHHPTGQHPQSTVGRYPEKQRGRQESKELPRDDQRSLRQLRKEQ